MAAPTLPGGATLLPTKPCLAVPCLAPIPPCPLGGMWVPEGDPLAMSPLILAAPRCLRVRHCPCTGWRNKGLCAALGWVILPALARGPGVAASVGCWGSPAL